MKISIIILALCILSSCKRTNVEPTYKDISYKVFAYDFNHTNSKDICLSKKQLSDKGNCFLSNNQVFVKVGEKDMDKARNILIHLLDSCQSTENNSIKPKSIDYYFRQYIGYKEGNVNYIYINLCAFYNETFLKSGLLISDCYLTSILSTPERGYAGHVIIDMDKLAVKEYHFEEFPEIEE